MILNPGSIHLLTEGVEERARRERDASIFRDINLGPKGIIVAAPPREERNHHYRRDHPWISRDSIYRRSPTLDHLFLITTAILPPETLLHLSGLPIPVAALYVRVDVRVLLSLSLLLAPVTSVTHASIPDASVRPTESSAARADRRRRHRRRCCRVLVSSVRRVAFARRAYYWLEPAVPRDRLALFSGAALNSPRAFPRLAATGAEPPRLLMQTLAIHRYHINHNYKLIHIFDTTTWKSHLQSFSPYIIVFCVIK